VLLSIQGGSNLGIFEINDAAQLVKEAAHPEANIIFGTVIDDTLGDEVRVTVIAAGFDGGEPSLRIDAVGAQRPVSAPVVPVIPADDVARDLDAAEEQKAATERAPERRPEPAPVTARVPETSYDGGYADDDLDVPDFLK